MANSDVDGGTEEHRRIYRREAQRLSERSEDPEWTPLQSECSKRSWRHDDV